MTYIFLLSIFFIFYAMIGYNLTILILGKMIKKTLLLDYSIQEDVTILVVAHNEEKVIEAKLQNLIELNYPKHLLHIVVASDNSIDNTNNIVNDFIQSHPDFKIRLYKVTQRKGKTNAQNEAMKTVNTKFTVFTDANAMFDKEAVNHLLATFADDNVAYVCGNLIYKNEHQQESSENEATYWNLELKIRDIESRIQTITAGNGAIYACKTQEYVDVALIKSHDSAFPLYYGLLNKRCVVNSKAICFEKAGESYEDEYKRKVRMNRTILSDILPSLKLFNIFKYRWFSFFYFGHRTLRYSLWLLHIIAFISNLFLIHQPIYLILFILQCIFYSIAMFKQLFNINYKIFNLIYYYTITIVAQMHGVYNILTGKAKPFWEKAETTR